MDQLPDEILIRILKNLNTYDLVQYCRAFNNSAYFLREKDLIKSLDWSKAFRCSEMNLCKFISNEMEINYIKVLKIAGIYWIPAQDLRKLLGKLPVLEELHAIDTRLGLRSVDLLEYTKLKKLSVSAVEDPLLDKTNIQLKLLKFIYLKLEQRTSYIMPNSYLTSFICGLENLQELWVEDNTNSQTPTLNLEKILISLKNLQKIVISTQCFMNWADLSTLGLTKTFVSKRFNINVEYILEKLLTKEPETNKSIFEPKESELEMAWDTLDTLLLPSGPEEQRSLALGAELVNISFHELNFYHAAIFCNVKYVKATHKILKSTNCAKLKKLNFNTCLFEDYQQNCEEREDTVAFKRPRIGVKINSTNHPFEKVCQNFKNLSELEIFVCEKSIKKSVVSAYPLIANFEKLKRLTLEIPLLVDGSFLEQVFQKCQYLEYLKIIVNMPNEKFLHNLYLHCKHAVFLKDFSLECLQVNLEKLFASFCQIPNTKLLRIFIECDTINFSTTTNEIQLFSKFLDGFPQLVFFFLLIKKATGKQRTTIRRVFDEYKKGQPAKLFICRTESCNMYPVTPAHGDMLSKRTRVAVIDFDKF